VKIYNNKQVRNVSAPVSNAVVRKKKVSNAGQINATSSQRMKKPAGLDKQ
jgi:hypothetical protein